MIKRLLAAALLCAAPVFAAASTNSGTPVAMTADFYRVHGTSSSAGSTVSASSSVIVTGINGRQLDLVINVTGTLTGSPTITYCLQEVDPGNLTTVIGSQYCGTAISTVSTQVLSFPGSVSSAVKVSWTFTGTSMTGVWATLRAKAAIGLVGQTTGARSSSVVLASDWAEPDRTNTGTLSAQCSDANINACGSFANSTVSVSMAGYPGGSVLLANSAFTCTVKADVSSGGAVWIPTKLYNPTVGYVDSVDYSASSASELYGIMVPMGMSDARVRCSSASPSGSSSVGMRASFALAFQGVMDLVSDSKASASLSAACTDANIQSCGSFANSTAEIPLAGQMGVGVSLPASHNISGGTLKADCGWSDKNDANTVWAPTEMEGQAAIALTSGTALTTSITTCGGAHKVRVRLSAVTSGSGIAQLRATLTKDYRRINRLAQSQGNVTLTTTSETTLIASQTGVFLDLLNLHCTNGSATLVRVDLRDATAGTVRDGWWLGANGGGFTVTYDPNVPFRQTASGNNWTLQLSGAVTDVRCTATALENAL